MKLVELLAKELKEWPEGAKYACQDTARHWKGSVFFVSNEPEYNDGSGDWTVCGVICAIANLEVSSDAKINTVTEDQWQAEREKMNKPKWIRHRGGKCPVPCGTKVETRHRDGNTYSPHFHTQSSRSEVAANAVWKHQGDAMDIMAYRIIEETKDQEIEEVRKFSKDVDMNIGQGEIIHGPVSIGDTVITAAHPKFDTNLGTLTYKLEIDTTSAMTALNELSAKWDQLESPLKWRDEIIELEAYEEEFRREREKLIRKLESEGFKLIGHVVPVYGEALIDMSDWRNWQAGDIVECLTDTYSGVYTKGQQYEVKSVNRDDFNVFDNYGEPSSCGWDDDDCDDLKFVRRP